MNSMTSDVRVRIAPSPTGDWHLGNARTALFSYLFARKHNGKFFLRIEDTDQSRLVEGVVDRLLHILSWLDMKPDSLDSGEPYFVQSKNLSRYQEIAQQLVEEGKAYYCFATAEELEAMRQEQQANKQAPRYDDRWGYRDLSLEAAKQRLEMGDRGVIRLKMPQAGEIAIIDLIHGELHVNAALLDDHVILKSDGFPTYHLAHVIDDHDMGITHVIRGDEWLSSAPRHVELHKALGWKVPNYAHVPVILGPDKGKLSKRHGAKPVFEYEEDGYLPEALTNFLVLLGWSSGTEQEIFSREELIRLFDFDRVHASPAVFDKDRLDWFNASYIRTLSVADLRDKLLEYWKDRDARWAERYQDNPEFFDAIVAELQTRLTTLKEFPDLAYFFFEPPHDFSTSLIPLKTQTPEAARTILQQVMEGLEELEVWGRESIESALHAFITEHNFKTGEVLWPIRVALTGLPASPGAYEMLTILGPDESLRRLKEAANRM